MFKLIFSRREMQLQAMVRTPEVVQEHVEEMLDSLREIKIPPGRGVSTGVVR